MHFIETSWWLLLWLYIFSSSPHWEFDPILRTCILYERMCIANVHREQAWRGERVWTGWRLQRGGCCGTLRFHGNGPPESSRKWQRCQRESEKSSIALAPEGCRGKGEGHDVISIHQIPPSVSFHEDQTQQRAGLPGRWCTWCSWEVYCWRILLLGKC